MRHRRRVLLLLRQVGDQRLGRQQQRGDRRRILQRHPLDLGRVDDPRLQHVHELHALGVEARVTTVSALTFSTMTLPSRPAFSTIWRIGSSSARLTIWAPTFSSPSILSLSMALL